jgi:hypothetical protein
MAQLDFSKPDWKARHAAVAERMPPLDPIQPGFRIPSWINVADLRRLYCATLAADDLETDERIEALSRTTDPIQVLKIVAPYVKVDEVPIEPEKPAVEMASDTSSPDPALPVNIGEGGGATFTDHGVKGEIVEKFANSKEKAEQIAREEGGEVKGFD